MEYIQSSIFAKQPILCGMSIRGDKSYFPPSGFTFRQLSLSDEMFKLHSKAMEDAIGQGIGKRIVTLRQVHGKQIYDAGLSILPDGDGLHTKNPDIMLGIALADCCGIMIYDPQKNAIMALHAGWRGAKAMIGPKGIDIMMQSYYSNPEDLLIWLTPCAGKDTYEVGAEFGDIFPGHVIQHESHSSFDLRGYISETLINSGVRSECIENTGICTITDNRFHSYRRDGDLGRNIAFMGLHQ
jgi:hypothetical protein